MESPVGLRRTQACSSHLPLGHNNLDSLIWIVTFLPGTCIEVLSYVHPQERCTPTDLRTIAVACTVHLEATLAS
jgi:hypothetical protein